MENTVNILFTTALTIMASPVNRIQESDIGRGVLAMLNDASGFALVVGPILCAIAAMVFFARKGIADEHDGKMWQKRILIAIVSGVGILLVSAIVSLVTSYFLPKAL